MLGGICRWTGRIALLSARIVYLAGLVTAFQVWRFGLGFGEYPYRVLWFIPVFFLATWAAYWQLGTFEVAATDASAAVRGRASWDEALYYCFASFTALGYGGWSPVPVGWAKWAGAIQPFFGVFFALILSISVARLFTKSIRD